MWDRWGRGVAHHLHSITTIVVVVVIVSRCGHGMLVG